MSFIKIIYYVLIVMNLYWMAKGIVFLFTPLWILGILLIAVSGSGIVMYNKRINKE